MFWNKFISVVIIIFIFSSVVKANNITTKFILLQGMYLSLYENNKIIDIKRAEIIYGYGFINESEVFVAYQSPGYAEAIAIIEIVNVKTKKRKIITTIGGAGEAYFDANKATGEILFNDSDGINIITISTDSSFKIHKLNNTKGLFTPFWIDALTIGAIKYDKKYNPIIKIIRKNTVIR